MSQYVFPKKTETGPPWFIHHGSHRSRIYSAPREALGRQGRAFTIASMFLCDGQNGPGVSAKASITELRTSRRTCSRAESLFHSCDRTWLSQQVAR
jgi:hypothetical protein